MRRLPPASVLLLALALPLALAALLAGCSRQWSWGAVDRMIARDFPGAPSLPADALAMRLDGPDAPLLLDVRQAEEYAVSHLPGARRVEPEAEALPPELLALPRDTPIVAYCSVGYRSAALVERLRAEGFTRAENLEGSIFRWANEGRPVVRDGRAVAEVHPYSRAWGVLLDRGLHAWRPEGG